MTEKNNRGPHYVTDPNMQPECGETSPSKYVTTDQSRVECPSCLNILNRKAKPSEDRSAKKVMADE